jgi:hypothetical protein
LAETAAHPTAALLEGLLRRALRLDIGEPPRLLFSLLAQARRLLRRTPTRSLFGRSPGCFLGQSLALEPLLLCTQARRRRLLTRGEELGAVDLSELERPD